MPSVVILNVDTVEKKSCSQTMTKVNPLNLLGTCPFFLPTPLQFLPRWVQIRFRFSFLFFCSKIRKFYFITQNGEAFAHLYH